MEKKKKKHKCNEMPRFKIVMLVSKSAQTAPFLSADVLRLPSRCSPALRTKSPKGDVIQEQHSFRSWPRAPQCPQVGAEPVASPNPLPAQGPEEPSPSMPGSHRAAFPWHLSALTTAALEQVKKYLQSRPGAFGDPVAVFP